MIKPDIYIDLKEKDALISEWLSAVKEQGGNATAISLEAIAYYANTGRVLKIGGVTGEKGLERKRFHLLAPAKSEAHAYLSEQAEKGKKVSVIVKTILRAGIEKTDNCWVLTEEDMLLKKYQENVEEKSESYSVEKEVGHVNMEIPDRIEENLKTDKEEKMAEEDDIFAILNVPKFG